MMVMTMVVVVVMVSFRRGREKAGRAKQGGDYSKEVAFHGRYFLQMVCEHQGVCLFFSIAESTLDG